MKVRYFKGDITKLTADEADVIVNAANPGLLGGGGVDGSIHRAAGPKLKMFCECLPLIETHVRCRVGDAVWTPAFDLPFKGIIHTVGPIFEEMQLRRLRTGEAVASEPLEDLRYCLNSCLDYAYVTDCRRPAFPAISCGIYGGKIEDFARVAHEIFSEQERNFDQISVVLFTDEEHAEFERAWNEIEAEHDAKEE